MLTCAGDRITAPTGFGLTVTADVPDRPSDVAVMVTGPGATPVTRPVDDTVAFAASLVDQATARPVSVAPAPSFVVAVSCNVCATTMSSLLGLTVTDATGTDETVTATTADFPSLVAVTTAPPGVTAVMSPLALTDAIAVELLDQVIDRPV